MKRCKHKHKHNVIKNENDKLEEIARLVGNDMLCLSFRTYCSKIQFASWKGVLEEPIRSWRGRNKC